MTKIGKSCESIKSGPTLEIRVSVLNYFLGLISFPNDLVFLNNIYFTPLLMNDILFSIKQFLYFIEIVMSEVCPIADNWCLMSEDTIKTSFQWTIEKFSERPEKVGKCLESLTFSAKEDPKNIWFLKIYPNGNKEETKEFIELFLFLKASNEDVETEFTLALVDANQHLFGKRRATHEFSKAQENWGFPSFLSRTILEDPDNNLLPNDCLTIYCEVTTSGKTKSISGRKIEINRMGKTLSDDMTALFENPINTDIEIEVKGHKFSAHKHILMTRSPVFAAMFEHHMKESLQKRVIINDIEKEDFNNVLRFIQYRSHIRAPL